MKKTILVVIIHLGLTILTQAQLLEKNNLKLGDDFELAASVGPFAKEGYKLIQKNKKLGFLKFKKAVGKKLVP